MASENTFETEVVIVGAGLAGIVTAHELLDHGKRVLLVDKDVERRFGGLARESFGGICLVGTPHQRRLKIADTPELAWKDWRSYAEFEKEDRWPQAWAQLYCESSLETVYHFLDSKQVEFLPLVNWPERGWDRPGNSVPRWHIVWGTGKAIIDRLTQALESHSNGRLLKRLFQHEVSEIELENGRAVGVAGRSMIDGARFRASAEHVVVASGGVCGGDLSKARQNWPPEWGQPPRIILNGAHVYGDGLLHDRVADLGGKVTHLNRQWHYAAGVHHPRNSRPNDGLSLVPPRSALWMNARGERIGPRPLVSYTDTGRLVECVCAQPGQYSWQVMNWRIALKELAVSGGDYMTAFRRRSRLLLVKSLLFGNRDLVNRLIAECGRDIAVADTLPELADQMNQRSLHGQTVCLQSMQEAIEAYDAEIDRGKAFFNDEQLRRLANFMTYRGDRWRICRFQKILDPKARPLIAIREFILARKSLGGIQTDLSSRVLRDDGSPIAGLYAVGEAAGFGGGGIHGKRSLEGTFLGSCVLTGRIAGRAVAKA